MKLAKHITGSVPELVEDHIYVKDFANSKMKSLADGEGNDSFFVCDVGDVIKKWKKWQEMLPHIQPFYAVTCNQDMIVLKLLDSVGANFACASKGETQKLLDMGVSSERIMLSNPCKQPSQIKYSKTKDVKLLTFDNELELQKMKHHHPSAELIIHIKVDDSKMRSKSGFTNGVDPYEASQLLQVAWNMNLNVIGISFQVDRESTEQSRFYNAVKSAKMVFDEATDIGFDIKLLDVGGGFPCTDVEELTFEMVARKLALGISEFFPPECGVKVVAEPGRYLVASAYTLLSKIISVKEKDAEGNNDVPEGVAYHLNDGVYGSLSCILTDLMHPIPYYFQRFDEADLVECAVHGPTDDPLDCISSSIMLPKLSQGDWICFDNMGANAIPTASKFNGFKSPTIYYMCQRSLMDYIMVTESLMSCKKLMIQSPSYLIPVSTVC